MYKTVNWKTGPARARYNQELNNKKNKKKVRAQAPKRPSTRVGGPASPQAKKELDSQNIPDIK